MLETWEYESAIRHPTGGALMASFPVDPLEGQVRILASVVGMARGAGLEIPAMPWHWRAGGRDRGICGGAVQFHEGEKRIAAYLNADAFPEELARTAFHELQHVDDFATGRYKNLSRVDLERRADAFAERMFPSWSAAWSSGARVDPTTIEVRGYVCWTTAPSTRGQEPAAHQAPAPGSPPPLRPAKDAGAQEDPRGAPRHAHQSGGDRAHPLRSEAPGPRPLAGWAMPALRAARRGELLARARVLHLARQLGISTPAADSHKALADLADVVLRVLRTRGYAA